MSYFSHHIVRRVPALAAAASVVAIVVAGVAAQDRVGRVAALAQAEREFAAMSVAKGFAPSFHENFAEDGIGFWPHPVKVKAETANRPAPPADKPRAVLNWYPVLSDLATSGELGFNLGPSTTTPPPGDANAKPRYGYFFSVWKRQADGHFKVVLDIGSDVTAPVAADTAESWRPLRIEPWTAPAGLSIAKETDALRQHEAALSAALATSADSASNAYSAAFAADLWLCDRGVPPIVDKASADAHVRHIGARASRRFDPRHVELAQSGEFGYTWGAYKTTSADEEGYYAHVWRRDANGQWRLVIEVIRPTPPEKKPA